MTEQFSVLESIRKVLRSWWWIIIFLLAGSLVGWGISLTLPVVYEAKSTISTSVDFSRTGTLTDIEQDLIIVAAGDIISSDGVYDEVEALADIGGLQIDREDLKKSTTLERVNQTWTMRVRSQEAGTAKKLANLWNDTAYAALMDAYAHALNFEKLNRHMDALSSCINKMTIIEPVQGECSVQSLEDLQGELGKITPLAAREKAASQGLSTAINFIEKSNPDSVETVVSFGRGSLTLAGGLIGLLVGFVLTELGIFEALRRRKLRVG